MKKYSHYAYVILFIITLKMVLSAEYTEGIDSQRRTTSYLIIPPQNPGARNYRTGLFSDTRFRDSVKML